MSPIDQLYARLGAMTHVSILGYRQVVIGRTAYHAIAYQDGNLGGRTMLYCLGKLPPSYRGRMCYSLAGQDWYTACYWPAQIRGEQILPDTDHPHYRHHPEGAMFILTPWDLPDAIDRWEPRAYRRVPFSVGHA